MYEFIDKNGNISANSAKVIVIDKYGKVKQVGTGGGGSPTGPAGGDLSGTYPNPSVIWNNGTGTYDLLYYPLSTNPAGYITSAALAPYLTSATAAATYYPLTNPAGYITSASVTLQNAYTNSTNGKILLDLTRTAFKVQAILGTTNTIESYATGSLVPNFYVDISGNPFGNYFYAAWFNAPFGAGLQDTTTTVQFKSASDGIIGQGRWESNQRINYLADYSSLYSNRSLIDKGYADTTYVPKTRTLTINGTTYDLSADRSWTIAASGGTVTSVAALTLGTAGTDLSSTVANPTTTPVITLNVPDASATARGVITTGSQTIAGTKTLSSSPIISSEIASTIASFDASKNIKSLDTATYPSLTELARVKGLTSNAQTQLDARKKVIVRDTTTATVTGVAVETLAKTYEITSGRLTASGFLDFFAYSVRSGPSLPHTLTIKINSTNNFATATTIGTVSTNGNFAPILPMKGEYVLKSNLIIGNFYNSAQGTNYLNTTSQYSIACDNTSSSVWLFISVTPSTGQAITIQGVEILN